MCARFILLLLQQVCHLVLMVSTVAGNGYISEGEKRDFQRTSHLDQLSLSVQQSREKLDWLRPPAPGRFRDMSYLGYHRMEHALPPTPLPAASRIPLIPTLPSVSEGSLQLNRTKGKPGIVSQSVASSTAMKKVQESVTGSRKSGNNSGSTVNLEVSESETHSRRGVNSGTDGNRNSIPTKKEHLEVGESVHEPTYAAHAGYPGRGAGTSSGRVRIQVYRGPTKKVGYKYFAPWGYYVSQPSDDNKFSSYGYH